MRAPSASPTLKEEFIVKLILAYMTGMADPMVLLHQQRQKHFETIRTLNALARSLHNDTPKKLLIEGASLYIQALLKWMDLYEKECAASTYD